MLTWESSIVSDSAHLACSTVDVIRRAFRDARENKLFERPHNSVDRDRSGFYRGSHRVTRNPAVRQAGWNARAANVGRQ